MAIQDTSRAAFRHIQPQLGAKQADVYQKLREATVRGFDLTNAELARLLHWPINTVTPRVFELREQRLIIESDERLCGVTGFRAKAWKVKEEQE